MVLDRRDHTGLEWQDGHMVRATITPPHCYLEWRGEDQTLQCLTLGEGVDDIHDVLWYGGDLYVVSTSRNEILRFAADGRLQERLQFPGEGDAWHLNCLSRWNGSLVASAFGEFSSHRGYVGQTREAGFVFDVRSGEKLWCGLSQPHSPLQDGETLYVCDSENRRVLWRRGHEEGMLEFDSYTRGLAIHGAYLFVGLSQSRNAVSTGQGGKVAVIDRNNYHRVGTLSLPFREVYAIVPLQELEWLSLLSIPIRERDELLTKLRECQDALRYPRTAEAALERLQRHPVIGRLIRVWRWIKRDPSFGRVVDSGEEVNVTAEGKASQSS